MSPAPALQVLPPVAVAREAQPAMRGLRVAGPDAGSAPVSILVAEADLEIARAIGAQLMADGYEVQLARSAQHASALAGMRQPGLAILGELESERASFELLERMRRPRPPSCQRRDHSQWLPDMPVIMLGCGSSELDLLRAFEAGADDFLARPPRYAELRHRVRALLRRTRRLARNQLGAAGLDIDLDAREARLHGRRLELRRMEYELLAHLAADPDRVHPRQELLASIWGYQAGCPTRTLDSHASRLRRKLHALDGRLWIVNVRGVGYRLI